MKILVLFLSFLLLISCSEDQNANLDKSKPGKLTELAKVINQNCRDCFKGICEVARQVKSCMACQKGSCKKAAHIDHTTVEEKAKLSEEVHLHGPGCKHEHFSIKAPNGGTLVKLGGDAAILEVLLDENIGELKINVFDGLAKNQLKIEQEELKIKIEEMSLTLNSDNEGSFSIVSDVFIGVKKFEAELSELEIEGLPFDGILISYPEGN